MWWIQVPPEFDLVAVEVSGPGAAAEPVARLEQQRRVAVLHRIARGGDTGEATANHHDIDIVPANGGPAARGSGGGGACQDCLPREQR